MGEGELMREERAERRQREGRSASGPGRIGGQVPPRKEGHKGPRPQGHPGRARPGATASQGVPRRQGCGQRARVGVLCRSHKWW